MKYKPHVDIIMWTSSGLSVDWKCSCPLWNSAGIIIWYSWAGTTIGAILKYMLLSLSLISVACFCAQTIHAEPGKLRDHLACRNRERVYPIEGHHNWQTADASANCPLDISSARTIFAGTLVRALACLGATGWKSLHSIGNRSHYSTFDRPTFA